MTSEAPETKSGSRALLESELQSKIREWISPLGYDLVLLELLLGGSRKLQIFIDRLPEQSEKGPVGIEDCVVVAKALDQPLDEFPGISKLFPSGYELEVSSPGVDRPLRSENDFTRFAGKLARIHVFRPLTQEEIENAAYLEKNPKQKNFIGTLVGLQNSKVLIEIKGDSPKANRELPKVTIPLGLISKANLEPVFDFTSERATRRDQDKERKKA